MQNFYYTLIFLVISLLIGTFEVVAGELQFAAENINIRLCPPDTVEVTGEYFFTSSDRMPCKQRVHYPFPADSAAEAPFFVSVHGKDDSSIVSFNQIEHGISFTVEVPESDTATITVTYRQRFKRNTGRYILTTTTYWGHPLTSSNYSLTVPVNTVLTYLSYECDTVYTSGSDRIYSFFKKRFMPDRDLIFMWQGMSD